MTMTKLDEIEACIQDEPERATGLLAALDPVTLGRGEALRAARLAERAGDLDSAIRACNRILQEDENESDALRLLADIRSDRGEHGRAARLLEKLRGLGDPEAESELVESLVASGDLERARKVIEDMDARGDPRIGSLRESIEESCGSAHEGEADTPGRAGRIPSDAELVELCELLSGRQGVHARQWAAPDGRTGYSPVRSPVTPALVRQHLLGAITLGAYVVRRENTCRFMVFDVDIAASERRGRPGGRPPDFDRLLADTLTVARRIAAALADLGMNSVLERSGGKGHHAWVFFAGPWPARFARELALGLSAACRPLPETVSVDVFPAQARVTRGGLGNLVKLPLGVHQRTGRRSVVLDRDGRPVEDPVRALCEAPRAPREVLDAALARVQQTQVMLPTAAEQGAETGIAAAPGVVDREDLGWSRSEPVPCDPPYDLDGDIEIAFLLERCAALRRVVAMARAGQALTHEEQAALIYTVGHLRRGPEAANALLALAGHEPVLVSRLRGYPAGCRKLRARLGLEAEADGCDCRFDPTLGSYPHPLLHLASLHAEREIDDGKAEPAGARPQADERVLRLGCEIDRLNRMKRALGQVGDDASETDDDAEENNGKVIPFPAGGAGREHN